MKSLLLALALLAAPVTGFDKTVHDFGTIGIKDGPQTCVFTFTNDSDAPVSILAVVTSCGCTELKWTRERIEPGAKGTITVTYSNDDGPYPFDKTVSAYLSDRDKPVTLHVKCVVKNI